MGEPDALHRELGNGWSLIAAGARRDGTGNLSADVILGNGRPVSVSRVAVNDATTVERWAREVSTRGRPDVQTLVAALLEMVPELEAILQDHVSGSQARSLVDLLQRQVELWHDSGMEPWATISIDGHQEHWPVHSSHFKRFAARIFYQHYGAIPRAQTMTDALSVVAGQALFDSPEYPVFTRLGSHEGAIYLDLGTPDRRVVRTTPHGWQVISDPPIRFRRPHGLQSLSEPCPGGTVDLLRPFLNLEDDASFALVLAWLLQALNPAGPFPVLVLHGQQGSAKTTSARVLRGLIDPNAAPLRSEPREARDLMIAATNGLVVAFDNLSHLPPWLSDAFCRLATGGGFGTRKLYSDDEETLFDAKRPVILNGIEELATRADLLDRAIIQYLPSIPSDRRRPEVTFWREFERTLPLILGALLDAVAKGMRDLESTQLDSLPRMADFARWTSAALPACGYEPDTFLRAYTHNQEEGNALTLEASPITEPLLEFMKQAATWEGTASMLLAALEICLSDSARRPQGWPRGPRALSNALRRLQPNLPSRGLAVTFSRDSKQRLIRLDRVGM